MTSSRILRQSVAELSACAERVAESGQRAQTRARLRSIPPASRLPPASAPPCVTEAELQAACG